MNKPQPPWIKLNHINVMMNNTTILHDCHWSLHENEHWAIVGPNGSGKSTFLRLIKGEQWPAPGHFEHRQYRVNGTWQHSPIGVKEKIGYVSPEQQAVYLRQEWLISAYDVLATGFIDTPLLYGDINNSQKDRIQQVVEQLHLQSILERPLHQLSQGQARKILIARALLNHPKLLILDEVCDGLDHASRISIIKLIEELCHQGIQILYATHRVEEFPSTITHELLFDSGKIVHQLAYQVREINTLENLHFKLKPEYFKNDFEDTYSKEPPLISIQDCNVWLEEDKILSEVNWYLYPGQSWAILGPNGCGKSTFLRLLYAELRPELGGSIRWFGKSDWHVTDLRQYISMVSNHLQATYTYDITALEVIVSGFENSIGLYETIHPDHKNQACAIADKFNIQHLNDQPISTLSYGEFRKVLLARAVVHQPKILILDEPLNGLDQDSRKSIKQQLNQLAEMGVQLVMVTHHQDDLLPSITHIAQMEHGKITKVLTNHKHSTFQ